MGGKGSGAKPGQGAGKLRGPQRNPRECSHPCGTRARYKYHLKYGQDCAICRQGERDRARIKQGYIGKPKQTSKERKAAVKKFLIQQQFSRGECLDCGLKVTNRNLCVFDWNHRIPKDKLFTIGTMKHSHSVATLIVEIAKCDLLCSNCHRMETQRQREEGMLTGYKVKHGSLLTLFDCPSPM